MRTLISKICLALAVLVFLGWYITPLDKQLRLGKDLRGGVSLVYSVQLKPSDPPDVMGKVIEVLKERVDPQGLAEISIVQQGRDRLEVTMPLPNDKVKRLKRAYEESLDAFNGKAIDAASFEQIMRLDPAARAGEIDRVSQGLPTRADLLKQAAEALDNGTRLRAEAVEAEKVLKAAQEAKAEQPQIDELQKKFDDLVEKAASSLNSYEEARRKVLETSLTREQVRKALTLSNEPRRLLNAARQLQVLPSPREQALTDLKTRFKDQVPQIDAAVAAFATYAEERTPLDDAGDLERLLSGAGVLDFRITVNPNEHPQEERLRRELREQGPRNVRASDARWMQVHQIDNWYDSVEQLEFLRQNPQQFFASRGDKGYVAEEYNGDYFILCWDVRGSRLTKAEGEWRVSKAMEGVDQLGRPSINFEMDPRGASLLGELTKQHVGNHMAVLLDDKVYTAPTLQSAISKNGQITGSFSTAERNYIIRVLGAGSLQAKLSPEPISRSNLGPELGADNLRRGLETGLAAFLVVSIFMCVYYFPALGGIAVVALWVNLLMILGIMALNRAAFTLPGIAGIILTFGQAVDANVLVYERMREEFRRGADMKTAVRLGFSKAFSSIVDGNVANLIVCAVLYQVGTQEIKGFAITLAIGVLATLFGTLIISRLLFTLFVDHLGWRRTSMLPMAIPGFQQYLTPKINWIRLRWPFVVFSVTLVGVGLVMAWVRGPVMLDTAFRGGTQIELTLRTDPATNQPLTLTRQQVEDKVKQIAESAAPGDEVRKLAEAEILPVNPKDDGVTSSRFQIKTFEIEERAVLEAITSKFADVIESRAKLSFQGLQETDWRKAPVYKVLVPQLGEDIDRPSIRDDVTAYRGGVAIVLDSLSPPASRREIEQRLDDMRLKPEFSNTIARKREVRVIGGTEEAATAAVVLVHDDAISSFANEERWGVEVADTEWRLVKAALGQASQLANVQTFSPTIAATFVAQAIVAIALSLLLLTIYVWVRFGAARWALAATAPLFHDILSIIGLIAIAQILFERFPGFSNSVGILPFKIDLNLVAAMLTIAGYSLNDTIIILDRIRENKGKLQYASAQQINDSINQTFSRTLITSGTTLISTVILYVFGGEVVRGFAYAFTLGVFIGTYSSIAISAPLVWSRKSDKTSADPDKGRTGEPALASAQPA